MISDIEQQKADEIKLKDLCVKSKAENAHTEAVLRKDKEMPQTKIADLTSTIENLGTDIEGLNAEIDHEFQQTVADQRATQKPIGSALDVLKGTYGAALVKRNAPTA